MSIIIVDDITVFRTMEVMWQDGNKMDGIAVSFDLLALFWGIAVIIINGRISPKNE